MMEIDFFVGIISGVIAVAVGWWAFGIFWAGIVCNMIRESFERARDERAQT